MRYAPRVRWRILGGALLTALLLTGCASEIAVFVDLRTDFEPGVEFDRIETSFYQGDSEAFIERVELAADPSASYLPPGVRVAELAGLPPGYYRVEAVLLLSGVEVGRGSYAFTSELSFGAPIDIFHDRCFPTDEVCNGRDDDCDDAVDEGDGLALCPYAGVAAAVCESGACRIEGCAEGQLDCDADVLSGCEVDGASDEGSCGACGVVCEAGLTCERSECRGRGEYVADVEMLRPPLELVARPGGGFVVRTGTLNSSQQLEAFDEDLVPVWTTSLYTVGLFGTNHRAQQVHADAAGRLHVLIRTTNTALMMASFELLGTSFDIPPQTARFHHARFAADGTLEGLLPLPFDGRCPGAGDIGECVHVSMAGVDDAGGLVVVREVPSSLFTGPRAFVTWLDALGAIETDVAVTGTSDSSEGFWSGATIDSSGRVAVRTRRLRAGEIDLGGGALAVSSGLSAVAVYDADGGLAWVQRYRGTAYRALFTAAGDLWVVVDDASRIVADRRDADGAEVEHFVFPFDDIGQQAFEADRFGGLVLGMTLRRSVDFGGGFRAPLLTSGAIAAYAPDGSYRYDHVIEGEADVMVSSFAISGDRIAVVGSFMGEIDFGGGLRTPVGAPGFLVAFRD